MGLAPLEPEFKTLQEKNYPKFVFTLKVCGDSSEDGARHD